MEYDVIVIGGGASGMIAAITAAERGKRVLLLEKNTQLGKKLAITGGTRCNITNAETDTRTLLARYGSAEPFLHSAFSEFGVEDTFKFFERLGLPLVVQGNKRAFPHTERAVDVVRALTKRLAELGVEVRLKTAVTRFHVENDAITAVEAGNTSYTAGFYILATGGVSHPETGSTGDGFGWLRALGHTVADPTPTIVPLAASDAWIAKLMGKTLPDVKISFFQDAKRKFSRRGNILLTHFGLSGPTILNAANEVHDLLYTGAVTAQIDLFPDRDIGILDTDLRVLFDANKNKMLRNVLPELLPNGTSTILAGLVPGLNPETKVHSVTKEERRALAHLLKALPVTITGLMGFDRAVVADGGVPLSELDMRTMRSKKYHNLSITGDLLHINRPSGGYSLQLCWTTGFVAGTHS
jgi:hypothetical protein